MAKVKTLAENRKARRDYHIEEKYEAGLSLLGTEVKSIREGKAIVVEGVERQKQLPEEDAQLAAAGRASDEASTLP